MLVRGWCSVVEGGVMVKRLLQQRSPVQKLGWAVVDWWVGGPNVSPRPYELRRVVHAWLFLGGGLWWCPARWASAKKKEGAAAASSHKAALAAQEYACCLPHRPVASLPALCCCAECAIVRERWCPCWPIRSGVRVGGQVP
jgi:hypothetical protein